MEIIFLIWAVFFGLIIGSFLNVCIYRVPLGKSLLFPGSSCVKCNTKISWYDNIPVLSYLILLGKCRNCKTKISIRYVIVELISGLITGAFLYQFLISGNKSLEAVIIYVLLSYTLIVIAFIDIDYLIVPNAITYSGMILILVFSIVCPEIYYVKLLEGNFALNQVNRIDSIVVCLIGMAVSGGIVYLTAIIGKLILKKDAMGIGDAKLMCMCGGIIGWKLGIIVFFIAPFFGLLLAVPMLIFKNAKRIPYAPFLSLAILLVIFYDDYFINIIDLYASLFKL